jgi:hypothetical protein
LGEGPRSAQENIVATGLKKKIHPQEIKKRLRILFGARNLLLWSQTRYHWATDPVVLKQYDLFYKSVS